METLAQWSYVSSSTIARADFAFEVRRIVLVSRSRNAASLLTGALFSSTTRFLQYLEGPPDALAAVRAAISADPRHGDIVTLAERMRGERLFSGWSLAYGGQTQFGERVIDQLLATGLGDPVDRGDRMVLLFRLLCDERRTWA